MTQALNHAKTPTVRLHLHEQCQFVSNDCEHPRSYLRTMIGANSDTGIEIPERTPWMGGGLPARPPQLLLPRQLELYFIRLSLIRSDLVFGELVLADE